MTGLEVTAHENDDLRVRVVRTGSIHPHPPMVAGARTGRAHVGVRVVPVDPPCGEHPGGETVLARTSHVVHDLLVALLFETGTDT